MQTSDLNVNNTESDHVTAIFRQFQDAILSREHTSVKTSTKIIFDFLQWQEVATLSLSKKSFHRFFHLNIFHLRCFCLGANDIARNRSRAIFSGACVVFATVKSSPRTFFMCFASLIVRSVFSSRGEYVCYQFCEYN